MNRQEKIIAFLYRTPAGRGLLKLLIRPRVSMAVGRLMNAPCSRLLIPGFIRKNQIDLTQFEEKKYRSYNDFFTRRVKTGCRPLEPDEGSLVAPCDGRLSVYPIEQDSRFRVKGTSYTMEQLTHNRRLARRYEGGLLLLYRLSVEDYHRYCYIDDGIKSANYRIPGVFHTVNPIANDHVPIYKENTREFSLLKSHHFGTVLMMEVGALCVGRIVNYHGKARVCRGAEKGRFEFGGSTVILCFQKERVQILPKFLSNTEKGVETPVKLGEAVGHS